MLHIDILASKVMCPVIRISDDVYSRLENHAVGFDTPANVIERLLDHYEGMEKCGVVPREERPSAGLRSLGKRDTTKYLFRGSRFGKGRLVLAVVKEYVTDHPETSLHDLQLQFPRHLQGSSGVFDVEAEALAILERTGHKRHFLKPDELVRLMDATVAISTEWNKNNVKKFIGKSRSMGYGIEEMKD